MEQDHNQVNEETRRPAEAADKKTDESKLYQDIVEWIKAFAIAAILVFFIRWLLFAPFIVDGDSMLPNFESRERLIVNKIIYDIREPKRGEVVVFRYREDNKDFIKRVIGLPGDRVVVQGDALYINGKQMVEPYLLDAIAEANAAGSLYNTHLDFPSEYDEEIVPQGALLVLGDNRGHSKDSRQIGYVPYDVVVGRADIIFWPLNKASLVEHEPPLETNS